MEKWMTEYCRRMKAAFGSRVRFIGLQGSRARGEANENSDIDVVCILDTLNPADIACYRDALDGMEKRELICGFLAGWNELMHWEASDLFMFYYDTVPFAGTLDVLKDRINTEAVERAIRIGVGNIYHGCIHNMAHARDEDTLRGLYKAAMFVLRALAFRRSGKYARKTADLEQMIESADLKILKIYNALKEGTTVDFDGMSETLLEWAKGLIA